MNLKATILQCIVINISINIYTCSHNQDAIAANEEIANSLKDKAICIELGPTTALSKNDVLKWVLVSIAFEPAPSQEFQAQPKQIEYNISSENIEPKEKDVIDSSPPSKEASLLMFSTLASTVDQVISQTSSTNPSLIASSSSVSAPTPIIEERDLHVCRLVDFEQLECASASDDNIN